ncbi:MAG: carboxypeptidase-like regulatory domain-containing protein [Vicinamibacterales bacterium]
MRLRLLSAVLLTTSACAAPSPTVPSAGPWRFTGNILELNGGRVGAPIANADLVVVSGVNKNAHATTDGKGRFVFPRLDSGRFTVSIAAPGYVSNAPVVDLYRDVDANFGLIPR